jgi:PAS domain S-box-containing protein
VEFRQQTAGGSFRWCSVSACPIRDGDGRIVRWLGERIDIHDGKELQSRLEEERALLTAVLENLPVGVSVADPAGRLTMINKRTFEIWRGRQSESRSVAEYGEWRAFHPDGRRYEGADWPIARSLTARETVTDHECVFERSDGTRGILNLCTAPVLNGRGKLNAAVATCADVTDLRRMHEAETRRLAAEQLAAATRNLLSNCSHELRTVGGGREMGSPRSWVCGQACRREGAAAAEGVSVTCCDEVSQLFCVRSRRPHTRAASSQARLGWRSRLSCPLCAIRVLSWFCHRCSRVCCPAPLCEVCRASSPAHCLPLACSPWPACWAWRSCCWTPPSPRSSWTT